MKIKSTLLILACFTMLSSFSQNDLKLTLVKDNDQPISKIEHFYLFEIENNTDSNQVINMHSINTLCSDVNQTSQIELNHTFLKEDKSNFNSNLIVNSNSSKKVYLKIYRPNNPTLNSWNCTEVTVTNSDNTKQSNSIVIKTLVPDPKDDN